MVASTRAWITPSFSAKASLAIHFSLELDVIPKLTGVGWTLIRSIRTDRGRSRSGQDRIRRRGIQDRVSKTVSVSMAVVAVVGISLSISISGSGGLGLCGPLAVVPKTVSVVAKTGVSVVSKTVSVGTVSKTMVAQ